MTLPSALKILPLSAIRSLLSIPGPRGLAPTNSAASMSVNATVGSSVHTMSVSSGNAQSSSSMRTDSSSPSAGVISSRFSATGWSGP